MNEEALPSRTGPHSPKSPLRSSSPVRFASSIPNFNRDAVHGQNALSNQSSPPKSMASGSYITSTSQSYCPLPSMAYMFAFDYRARPLFRVGDTDHPYLSAYPSEGRGFPTPPHFPAAYGYGLPFASGDAAFPHYSGMQPLHEESNPNSTDLPLEYGSRPLQGLMPPPPPPPPPTHFPEPPQPGALQPISYSLFSSVATPGHYLPGYVPQPTDDNAYTLTQNSLTSPTGHELKPLMIDESTRISLDEKMDSADTQSSFDAGDDDDDSLMSTNASPAPSAMLSPQTNRLLQSAVGSETESIMALSPGHEQCQEESTQAQDLRPSSQHRRVTVSDIETNDNHLAAYEVKIERVATSRVEADALSRGNVHALHAHIDHSCTHSLNAYYKPTADDMSHLNLPACKYAESSNKMLTSMLPSQQGSENVSDINESDTEEDSMSDDEEEDHEEDEETESDSSSNLEEDVDNDSDDNDEVDSIFSTNTEEDRSKAKHENNGEQRVDSPFTRIRPSLLKSYHDSKKYQESLRGKRTRKLEMFAKVLSPQSPYDTNAPNTPDLGGSTQTKHDIKIQTSEIESEGDESSSTDLESDPRTPFMQTSSGIQTPKSPKQAELNTTVTTYRDTNFPTRNNESVQIFAELEKNKNEQEKHIVKNVQLNKAHAPKDTLDMNVQTYANTPTNYDVVSTNNGCQVWRLTNIPNKTVNDNEIQNSFNSMNSKQSHLWSAFNAKSQYNVPHITSDTSKGVWYTSTSATNLHSVLPNGNWINNQGNSSTQWPQSTNQQTCSGNIETFDSVVQATNDQYDHVTTASDLLRESRLVINTDINDEGNDQYGEPMADELLVSLENKNITKITALNRETIPHEWNESIDRRGENAYQCQSGLSATHSGPNMGSQANVALVQSPAISEKKYISLTSSSQPPKHFTPKLITTVTHTKKTNDSENDKRINLPIAEIAPGTFAIIIKPFSKGMAHLSKQDINTGVSRTVQVLGSSAKAEVITQKNAHKKENAFESLKNVATSAGDSSQKNLESIKENGTAKKSKVIAKILPKPREPLTTGPVYTCSEQESVVLDKPLMDGPSSVQGTFCVDCNKMYPAGCTEHDASYTRIDDVMEFTKARSSIPQQLALRVMGNQDSPDYIGVIAKCLIPPKTQFGPLLGVQTTRGNLENPENVDYVWALFDDKEPNLVLDCRNEYTANWLMFVKRARCSLQQNVTVYQQGRDLFFITVKAIPANTELLYWYSSDYARMLGVGMKPEEKHKCPCCHRKFTDVYTLKTHTDSAHTNLIRCKHECPTCGKMFLNASKLHIHQNVHRGNAKFLCNDCGKSFNNRSNLNRHAKTHTETARRPFSCEVCGKSFTQKVHLTSHIDVHSESRDYICELCGGSFRRKADLTNHENQVHSLCKVNKCSYPGCEKEFYHCLCIDCVHSLGKVHKCTHPGCEKEFYRLHNLKTHLLTHTDVRKYTCTLCEKAFRQKAHLMTHMERIHKNYTLGNGSQVQGVT